MTKFMQNYIAYEKTRGNFSEELLEKWLDGKGINQWYYYPNGYKLNPNAKACIQYNMFRREGNRNLPPHLDHGLLFVNSTEKKVWLVYQPYNLTDKRRDEIEDWASRNDLHASFDDCNASWYNPGQTSMVIIEKNLLTSC